MTGKLTLSIYDDTHHQNAEGLEYDLWRVVDSNNRVNIKHDQITDQHSHLLVQANTLNDLGSFELVLFVKDYFERFNENLHTPDSRMVVPVGFNSLDEDNHLSIRITPTTVTCTL